MRTGFADGEWRHDAIVAVSRFFAVIVFAGEKRAPSRRLDDLSGGFELDVGSRTDNSRLHENTIGVEGGDESHRDKMIQLALVADKSRR